MEELGNTTLLKLQADKLCSYKSFCTEAGNSCFPCLEMKVKQVTAFSKVLRKIPASLRNCHQASNMAFLAPPMVPIPQKGQVSQETTSLKGRIC